MGLIAVGIDNEDDKFGGFAMEKMKMESIDMTEKNIEIIEKYFPNCITEKNESSAGGGTH